MELSPEQRAIVAAPMAPLSVIACAGSGKTATAIHRVVEMRRRLGEGRGRIALLSFSNVAVETFRAGYKAQSQYLPAGAGRSRVEIDTLDGCLTSNILRPHGHRTMGANCSPFLVIGSEPFLEGFKCRAARIPVPIINVNVGFDNGRLVFFHSANGRGRQPIDPGAEQVVARLGAAGGYTHDLGRYWCYRILMEQPDIRRAVATRYPHIVVDEAQDIGGMHRAILEILIREGVQVSLIGDPNQGIYEFMGATGEFLSTYQDRPGVQMYSLTTNYRALPSIQAAANSLSAQNNVAARGDEASPKGAFFVGYRDAEIPQLVEAFRFSLQRMGIPYERAAIVCRSKDMVKRVSGLVDSVGYGVVKDFAEAALLRDVSHRYFDAFKSVVKGTMSLVQNAPPSIVSRLSASVQDSSLRQLKRKLWFFARNHETGLPSSALDGRADWHSLLLERLGRLLDELQNEFELLPVDGLSGRITRRDLPDGPLIAGFDLAAQRGPRIRVDSVHQVKGESIDGVLYIGTTPHIRDMLGGVGSEQGRIGYVAVTRARDLLWVAVPATSLGGFSHQLMAAGIRQLGQ